MPATNERVPSTGSNTQTHSAPMFSGAKLFADDAVIGKLLRSIMARMTRSASRSAMVTGESSALKTKPQSRAPNKRGDDLGAGARKFGDKVEVGLENSWGKDDGERMKAEG